LFLASIYTILFGTFIIFIGLVVLSIYALLEYQNCPKCKYEAINVVLLILGLIAVGLLVSYWIVINVTMGYYCFVTGTENTVTQSPQCLPPKTKEAKEQQKQLQPELPAKDNFKKVNKF
jgi:uncharacterized membrane protein YqhA